MASERKQELIAVDAPEEIFDVNGATISRRRRVAIQAIDDMKASKTADELYQKLAELIPAWNGIVDVDTGEALPSPAEDPKVFGRLDTEQLGWLSGKLLQTPLGDLKKSMKSGRT